MLLGGQVRVPGVGSAKISRFTLARGDAGVYQTVAAMRRLVLESSGHPVVQNTARRLAGGEYPGRHERIAGALRAYLERGVTYRPDPRSVEEITAPWIHAVRIQNRGESHGDCDDIATYGATLARLLGYRPRFVVWASGKHGTKFDHVFTEIADPARPGVWYNLDTLPIARTTKPVRVQAFPAV